MSQLSCPLCKVFLAAECCGQDFANLVQEAFEDDYEQMATFVAVVHFCFSIMENEQFAQFVATLYDTLGRSSPKTLTSHSNGNSISDVFFWHLLNVFDEGVLFGKGGQANLVERIS